eukprot:3853215-Rhodomonas_salina.2
MTAQISERGACPVSEEQEVLAAPRKVRRRGAGYIAESMAVPLSCAAGHENMATLHEPPIGSKATAQPEPGTTSREEDRRDPTEEKYDELTPPGQPSLRSQLSALTNEQMEQRLRSDFELSPREVALEEFAPGFRARRKEELLTSLLDAYAAAHAAAQLSSSSFRVRSYIYEDAPGVALPDSLTAPLLRALRNMSWKENARPGVQSSGYAVLKRQPAASPPASSHPFPQKAIPEHDIRVVRRTILELAAAVLQSEPANPGANHRALDAEEAASEDSAARPGCCGKAAQFEFTALAISRNFSASPHVDRNDVCPQYALSLGDFDAREGHGALCVEESPFQASARDPPRSPCAAPHLACPLVFLFQCRRTSLLESLRGKDARERERVREQVAHAR